MSGNKALPPIIQDEMQKRRMMKKATTVTCKFQTRMFVLYKHQLVYKTKNGKETRGSVSVMGIKICEDVDESSFNRPHVFQIGYLEKGRMFHLYIQAKSDDMRESWKFHIRKLCRTYNDHRMQQLYHPGHYKKDKWACCEHADKNNVGCEAAYQYDEKDPLSESSNFISVAHTTLHPHTPVLHRDNPPYRVKMPSECYDSDELDELRSPDRSPRIPDKYNSQADRKNPYYPSLPRKRLSLQPGDLSYSSAAQYTFEHRKYNYTRAQSEQTGSISRAAGANSKAYFGKSDNTYQKPTLSSHSMRYVSKPIQFSSSSSTDSPRDSCEVNVLSQSTPYYSPLGMGQTSDMSRLFSVSSTSANAGSDRMSSLSSNQTHLDSISSHMTRLDSQGSTIGSSQCESIPRTESDYQKRVDEEGETQGPVYTNTSMHGDLIFRMSSEGSRSLTDSLKGLTCEERCQSGSYVNYDGRMT